MDEYFDERGPVIDEVYGGMVSFQVCQGELNKMLNVAMSRTHSRTQSYTRVVVPATVLPSTVNISPSSEFRLQFPIVLKSFDVCSAFEELNGSYALHRICREEYPALAS